MSEIRFEKVQKRFKEYTVIKELNLTVRDGEFFTFVGPSGCGKSTILNMIAGLVPVSDGSIYFDDTVVNELTPKDRDIAMVFQSYALYPHMTVYKNIAFPLKMKKVKKEVIDRDVRRVAGLLGLGDLLHRKPKELSGGQRQRVALGRAIIRRPKVFLMDEPLSNLDAQLRIDMRAELKRLHHELKITTVYVTHDQAEALSLSDRIAVLHQGEIQQSGSPLEVYAKPANVFIGSFIGSPPMNLIPGIVQTTHPLTIQCEGLVFSLQTEHAPPEKTVLLGMRPEDLLIIDKKSDGCVEVSVMLIEPAGSFNWIDVKWGNTHMKGTASVDIDSKVGEKVYMKIPQDKIVVFDKGSERRL